VKRFSIPLHKSVEAVLFTGVFMQVSSNQLERVESAVYTVVQSLIGSQEALVEIGEKLHDTHLKRFFLTESLKRAEFLGELESVLNQEGVSDMRESDAAKWVNRAWAGLRKLRADDPTLLATAAQCEGVAAEIYDAAMSAFMPDALRRVLALQAMHIRKSQKFVKAAVNAARGRASTN
jgi:uncharacterized protein (TIGR02284 family)